MNYLNAAAALAVGLFLSLGIAVAQHRTHNAGHSSGHHAPAHHGSHFGHHNWHHVVPHHGRHIGAYFTVGNVHYYTPSPVSRIVSVGSSPALLPPRVVEVQKPVELGFAGFTRYDDLAGRLVFEANAMCLDMHYNYQNNKNFANAYRDAYVVLQTAKSIQAKEHQGNREIIRKRVDEMDRLFHHAQEEMRAWTRTATKQIGADTLPEKLAGVEAVLHHLCYDVGIAPHEQPAEVAPPPGEAIPPPLGKR
ncbi:MAG: hypothetical protein HYX68_11155 [Planctomycetes bacterium]|nr:hypothetical protein [Planctomycetota bacterium]